MKMYTCTHKKSHHYHDVPSTSFVCERDFSLQFIQHTTLYTKHHRRGDTVRERDILILLKNNALQAKGYNRFKHMLLLQLLLLLLSHYSTSMMMTTTSTATAMIATILYKRQRRRRRRMTVASNNERFNLHKRGRWIDGFSPNIQPFWRLFFRCVDNRMCTHSPAPLLAHARTRVYLYTHTRTTTTTNEYKEIFELGLFGFWHGCTIS